MAQFQVNDEVYVPAQRVDKNVASPFAVVKGKVTAIPPKSRSLVVDLPYGIGSKEIATSMCHKEIGILILKIGDFASELGLLNPLATSLERYCRLLVPSDQLKTIHLRTRDELEWVISTYHPAYTHWILVGHGGSGTLSFANNHSMTSSEFRASMEEKKVTSKFILSLCCHTGEAAFAKIVSQSSACKVFMGPKGAIHGASACHFAQSYLGYHFLEGKTTKVAFNQARGRTPGGTVLRHWTSGNFVGGR